MEIADLTIDLDGVGEHMGVIFPMLGAPVYRVRIETDMPEFIEVRGVYVPMGNATRCALFDYTEAKRRTRFEPLPKLPEGATDYDYGAKALIERWLEVLDLDCLLKPATLQEVLGQSVPKLPHVKSRWTADEGRVVGHPRWSEHWIPVTVRDANDPALDRYCGQQPWINVLYTFYGVTGFLTHDVW